MKNCEGTKTKGVHILSFSEPKTDKAYELQDVLNGFGVGRIEFSFNTNKVLMPIKLRIQEINANLSQLALRGLKDRILEEEQDSLTKKYHSISSKASSFLKDKWDEYNYLVRKFHKLCKTKEFIVENITTTVGRSVFAQILGNDLTYTGVANYCALGDDNTSPAVGDATLGNEVYRKAVSSGSALSNVTYLETFFTTTEIVDTLEEYGYFIDGTAGADTGQLYNRFIQSITKTITESLNVQSVITHSDA